MLICPICGKTFSAGDRELSLPFCSDRCRHVDLGRWLNEGYGFPVEPDLDVEAEDWEPENPEA